MKQGRNEAHRALSSGTLASSLRHGVITRAGSWAWMSLVKRMAKEQGFEYNSDALHERFGSMTSIRPAQAGPHTVHGHCMLMGIDAYFHAVRGWDQMFVSMGGLQQEEKEGQAHQQADGRVKLLARMHARFLACLYWGLRKAFEAASAEAAAATIDLCPWAWSLLEASSFAGVMEVGS